MENKTPWYLKEFSNYDAELYIPRGWEDNSWHNNACPHVEKSQGMYTACIFQDYKSEDLREDKYREERFVCCVHHEDANAKVYPNIVYEVLTNDIEVVKKFVEEVEQRYFN